MHYDCSRASQTFLTKSQNLTHCELAFEFYSGKLQLLVCGSRTHCSRRIESASPHMIQRFANQSRRWNNPYITGLNNGQKGFVEA